MAHAAVARPRNFERLSPRASQHRMPATRRRSPGLATGALGRIPSSGHCAARRYWGSARRSHPAPGAFAPRQRWRQLGQENPQLSPPLRVHVYASRAPGRHRAGEFSGFREKVVNPSPRLPTDECDGQRRPSRYLPCERATVSALPWLAARVSRSGARSRPSRARATAASAVCPTGSSATTPRSRPTSGACSPRAVRVRRR